VPQTANAIVSQCIYWSHYETKPYWWVHSFL